MMLWVYIVIALAAIGSGYAAVSTYNGAIERAEAAEAATKAANASAKSWEEEAKRKGEDVMRLQKTLAQRERDRRALQEERDHARGTIAELRKTPENRRWADVELPADVLAWVRNDAAGGASAEDELPRAPAGGSRTGADAAVSRPDKR